MESCTYEVSDNQPSADPIMTHTQNEKCNKYLWLIVLYVTQAVTRLIGHFIYDRIL